MQRHLIMTVLGRPVRVMFAGDKTKTPVDMLGEGGRWLT